MRKFTKQLFIAILVVSVTLKIGQAQSTVRVEYTLAGKLKGKAVLLGNRETTLFQRASDVDRAGQIVSPSTTGEPVAFNSVSAYLRSLLRQKLTYVESHTPYRYTVYDDALPVWTVLNEQRTLGGYACQKALTTFRGREFVAWFTKSIHLSGGPWKLAGLPGLILEAASTDGKYQYLFAGCTTMSPVSAPLTFSFKGPLLSYAAYVQKADGYYQERANRLHEQTTLEFVQRQSGATTGPLTMNIENIEKNLEKKYVSAPEK